jgi:hypothetical protein
MEIEFLDQETWSTRQELASAIFEWIKSTGQSRPGVIPHWPTTAHQLRENGTTRCPLRRLDQHN